jgi:hypothetical protein
MARDHTRVNLALWSDPDWRKLPPAAQHLYLTLWTSPGRTYCGTHDWRPNRLVKLAAGFTAEHLRTVAACLQARHFLVIDEETEEALIRSWARFDGLMRQPRMAVSYASAYADVASPTLRQVLVHETKKIHNLEPDLACWKDPRVASILDHPAVSARDMPTPQDPFGPGFEPGLALGLPSVSSGFGPNASQGLPPVCTPPTTATATSTKPSVVEGGVGGDDAAPKASGRKRPSTPLPDDFEANETNLRLIAERNLDPDEVVAHFCDHHASKDSRFADWQRALGTWIRRERALPRPTVVRSLPDANDIEKPPDGLTPAQYAAWAHAQKARRAQ